MIALILLAVSAKAADRVVETGYGVTEIECEEFCEYCGSNTAYRVDSPNFQVPNHLQSSSVLLQTQLSQLSTYLTGQVTVSISESWLCIQVTQFDSRPKLPALYNSLLSTKLREKHHFIESFDISSNQTFVSKSERTGSSVAWEEILIIYQDVESDLTEIQINDIVEMVNRDEQIVLYSGRISVVGGGNFEIIEEYGRRYYESFVVVAECEGDKLGKIEEENGCQGIQSPNGISSVHYLVPTQANFTYAYDGDKFVVKTSEFWAATPEFSPGPGVVFGKGNTYLLITPNSTCYMDITGQTQSRYKLQIILQETDFLVKLSPGKLSLSSLEQLLGTFYFDFTTLLPVYNQTEDFLDRLYSISTSETVLSVQYNPEAQISIAAQCKILKKNDCQLWGHVSRINSVVHSILTVTSISESGMSELLGIESEEGQITSSTVNTTFEGVSYVPGIFVKTQDFEGVFYPEDFYLAQATDEIWITEDLVVRKVEKIQFVDPFEIGYLSGEIRIFVGQEKLVFKVKLVEEEDGYLVSGKMVELWENPFNISTLQVPLLWIEFRTANSSIQSFHSSGEAVFYCGDVQACWYGQVRLDFPDSLLEDYSYSQLMSKPRSKDHIFLFLQMNPVSSNDLFEVLFSTDPTTLTKTFDFLSITNLSINKKHHLLNAQALCFGEPCTIQGSFATEKQYLLVDFGELTLGHGNLRVFPNPDLQLELEVTPGSLFGTMIGRSEIWNVSAETNIEVNENNAQIDLAGYLFGGIFNVTLELTVIITDKISESSVYAFGKLQEADMEQLTQLVNKELLGWMDKGAYVLRIAQNAMEQYVFRERPKSCSCEDELVCKTPKNRTIDIFNYGTNCLQPAKVCKSVELYCVQDKNYCLKTEVTCTEWYKNIPDTCKTVKKSCVDEVNVCQNWVEVCHDLVEKSCSEFEVLCIENYEKKDYYCKLGNSPDLVCEDKCNFQELVEEQQDLNEAMAVDAYYDISERLEGLNLLNGVTLFKIVKTKMDLKLDESGIGEHEIYFTFTAEIYSIDQAHVIESTTTILWDFFEIKTDIKQLYDWAKGVLIDESAGTLDEELKTRSALEVYFELF